MKLNNLIKEEINKYIETIICESLTNVVYHFTQPQNLQEIIKNNTFKLSFGGYNEIDKSFQKGYKYFMSLTRQKNGSLGFSNGKNVRIRWKKVGL